MKIQFNDLKDQYLDYKKVKKKISKIIDERNYILGKSVFDLEKKLSNFIGSKYCVTTSSGTDALLIALLMGLIIALSIAVLLRLLALLVLFNSIVLMF